MTPREIAEKSVFDLIESGDLSRFERLTAVKFIESLTKGKSNEVEDTSLLGTQMEIFEEL